MSLPDDKGFKKENGNLITKRYREEYVNGPLQWAVNVKILMSLCKEDSNYSGGKMNPPMDASQPPSPVNPVLTQKAHEQSSYGCKGGDDMSPTTRSFTHKSCLATATVECPPSQKHKPMLSFNKALFP